MPRNLDITALRSFVAVADLGGVTRAATALHLTQSAVSMQLKRLEDGLGQKLLDRTARSVALNAAGEQLLSYARRMVELNDDVFARMTDAAYEGEVTLGVPHDIVYPSIPTVLQQFNIEYPRVKVQLLSSYTRELKHLHQAGKCDLILTTEDSCDAGADTLAVLPLIWVGAPDGHAWRARPLRLAFETHCVFRETVERALDDAGIPWEMAVESQSTRTIEATVSADLAVHAMIKGAIPVRAEPIRHGGALPVLGHKQINLYRSKLARGQVFDDLVDLLRRAYSEALPGSAHRDDNFAGGFAAA